jgi:hypothetical protein
MALVTAAVELAFAAVPDTDTVPTCVAVKLPLVGSFAWVDACMVTLALTSALALLSILTTSSASGSRTFEAPRFFVEKAKVLGFWILTKSAAARSLKVTE